jgi:hypothetical protein
MRLRYGLSSNDPRYHWTPCPVCECDSCRCEALRRKAAEEAEEAMLATFDEGCYVCGDTGLDQLGFSCDACEIGRLMP